MHESKEPPSFFTSLGRHEDYSPLVGSIDSHIYTPRLFRFDSTSGKFVADEILCKYRVPDRDTQFPFIQVSGVRRGERCFHVIILILSCLIRSFYSFITLEFTSEFRPLGKSSDDESFALNNHLKTILTAFAQLKRLI